MELGFVMGAGSASSGKVFWAGIPDEPRSELDPLPFWDWGENPCFPGYRCEGCGLVEILYRPPQDRPTGPSP